MERKFALGSFLLFGLSILLLIVLTIFDPALAGLSFATQRALTFLLLVLPAGIGIVLGITSLSRKEGQRLLAIASIILNSLFALFHLMIILFAG
jgi:hypothetical protein